MRLLLVEDDEMLGEAVKAGLIQNGYTVDWLKDGLAATQALKTDTFDMVILDLGLPKLTGLEVLKFMRDNHLSSPVLILTAKETVEDRVKGLDAGADDYLTKPFDLGELCARLRALQRRFLNRFDTVITYKNVTLDPASHSVKVDGEKVNIARREFALLQKLLENVGTVISREQLAQSLYGWEEEVDSNALEVHIHNLRKKLGFDFIKTIRGIGYMAEPLDEDEDEED